MKSLTALVSHQYFGVRRERKGTAEPFQVRAIVEDTEKDDQQKRYWCSRAMPSALERYSETLAAPCTISSAVDGARLCKPARFGVS
eukprot:4926944-Amphidinium_carterae.1